MAVSQTNLNVGQAPARRPQSLCLYAPRSVRRAPFATSALGWGVTFFFVAQLSFQALSECVEPGLRDPVYAAKRDRLRACMAAFPERPLFLVLGTSRTGVGLRPDQLPAATDAGGRRPLVFNFGQIGADPVVELLNLRRLLADGFRPQWLAVELLPPLLHQDDDRFFALAHLHRLGIFELTAVGPYLASPDALRWRLIRERVTPTFAQAFLLREYFAPWLNPDDFRNEEWRRIDAWGWLPLVPASVAEPVRKSLQERTHAEYAAWFADYRIVERMDRAFRELLVVCRREGIPTTVFVMPESRLFQSWYTPAMHTRVTNYLVGLREECGVDVIDARDWLADDRFLDGHHLLRGGATEFTRRFGKEVVTPLLGARRSKGLGTFECNGS
jgi:hypothetical protein